MRKQFPDFILQNNIITTTNNLKASVVITTKNRKDELIRAIESCIKQKGNPEIFVFDDGSEDGTFEFVCKKYPSVKVHREEISLGLIDARTKAASLVKGDIIFSLDDDACFSSTDTILDILAFFSHPRIAVVSIPMVDVKKSSKIKQIGLGTVDDLYICAHFQGSAHALRKDVFHKLGGYRKNLERGGEETEYALKLYKNNFWIRIGNSGPILHYESPKRDKSKITFYGARNNVLIAWIYTPITIIIPYTLNLIIRLLFYGFKTGTIKSSVSGLMDSFDQIKKGKINRDPMTLYSFISYKILARKGSVKITQPY